MCHSATPNGGLQPSRWCDIKPELASIAPEFTEASALSAELGLVVCTDDNDESEADWLSRRCCRRWSILLCSINRNDGREPDAVSCEEGAGMALAGSATWSAAAASEATEC